MEKKVQMKTGEIKKRNKYRKKKNKITKIEKKYNNTTVEEKIKNF